MTMPLARGLLALAGFVALAAGQAAPAPLAQVEQVSERLRALAVAHPGAARLEQVGRSLAGREILALRVGPQPDGPPGTPQPGVLVVAGLDGRRAGDVEAVLRLAGLLLADGAAGGAPLPPGTCAVLVPLANPDGLAALLGQAGPRNERAGNGRPGDDDRDGRVDEDAPADLDGDGQVAWMRVPDPEGEWVVDAHDPRALRKARRERGERGTHRLLVEGLDADADGSHAEDGRDGVQPDRNFPHGWKEHDHASGAVPLSEPEARALAEFVLARPELFAVLVVGAQDTLAELPKGDAKAPGNWDGPLAALIDTDRAALEELQRRLRALPGGADHKVKGEGLAPGSFLAWSYHQAGRWPLALRLWEPPKDLPKPEKKQEAKAPDSQPAGEPVAGDAPAAAQPAGNATTAAPEAAPAPASPPADEPTSDASSPVPAAVLAWLDKEQLPGALPWSPFDHPQLEAVEIGGLLPGLLHGVPPAVLEQKVPLLAGLLREVLGARPQLAWEGARATRRADGLYDLEVALVNAGPLPAFTALAGSARLVRPLSVRLLLPDGAARLAGPLAPRIARLDGGGGREEFRWVLAGTPGQALRLAADSDVLAAPAAEVLLP